MSLLNIFFDPRAKNKQDLKGFIIFNDQTNKRVTESNLKKKILGYYLFWRHIYFEDDILGEIPLKPTSKRIFQLQLKFLEQFKRQIEERINKNYLSEEIIKDIEFIPILKKLDKEVLDQYPFAKEKIDIQISIFDSLYNLFTNPSDKNYQELINKIDRISELSKEENQIWNDRINTWGKLVKHYNLKIEKIPGPNFKKAGISVLMDLFKYSISKKYPIISDDTLKEIIKERSKPIMKETLKFLNDFFIYHKMGIDAIKRNIEINKKFQEVVRTYNHMVQNPPVEKIRD